MALSENLDGIKFGRLTATNKILRKKDESFRLCICDCGNKTYIPTARIKSGHTKSCGCFRKSFKMLKPGQAARNQILDEYKRGGAKRGYCWEITEEEFDTLLGGNCAYCGDEPNTTRVARRFNGNFTYNGIDRIDNNLGYTTSNVVSCCKICNRSKSSMTENKFLEHALKIAKFRGLI